MVENREGDYNRRSSRHENPFDSLEKTLFLSASDEERSDAKDALKPILDIPYLSEDKWTDDELVLMYRLQNAMGPIVPATLYDAVFDLERFYPAKKIKAVDSQTMLTDTTVEFPFPHKNFLGARLTIWLGNIRFNTEASRKRGIFGIYLHGRSDTLSERFILKILDKFDSHVQYKITPQQQGGAEITPHQIEMEKNIRNLNRAMEIVRALRPKKTFETFETTDLKAARDPERDNMTKPEYFVQLCAFVHDHQDLYAVELLAEFMGKNEAFLKQRIIDDNQQINMINDQLNGKNSPWVLYRVKDSEHYKFAISPGFMEVFRE